MTFTRTFVLGIIGGCFIAFGSLFGLSIGAALPGIMQSDPGLQRLLLGLFGLPLGLILVLVLGMELFTGNTMVMTIAVIPQSQLLLHCLQHALNPSLPCPVPSHTAPRSHGRLDTCDAG